MNTMNYDYYGISKDEYTDLINERNKNIEDYWKDGRHFSKHRTKDPGLASRIVDKNIYDNLLRSFYHSSVVLNQPQGVFYGYGHNDFTDIHLKSKFILKLDLKSCYRNIKFQNFRSIIDSHQSIISFPLPMELIESIYFPNNYLQAGLTASNIICDLVLKYNFDKPINKLIFQKGLPRAQFSRYYDDFYISSDDKRLLIEVKNQMKLISKQQRQPLNYKKCYLRTLNGSQILKSTIIDGEIRVSRKLKNNLRVAMFELNSMSISDDRYESSLRSVISKLANICRNENKPNENYLSAYESYRADLEAIEKGLGND